MLGGYVGQFLPLSGGKLSGNLMLSGNTLDMNTGGGSGGGNINTDGGSIVLAGGDISMNDGSGEGGDFFNADGAYFNSVGGMAFADSSATIDLAGGSMSMNGGGGSGGGNLSMDGGNIQNAGTIEFSHLSSGAAKSMKCSLQSAAAGGGGSGTVTGNDATGTVTLSLGTGTQTPGALLDVTFISPYSIAPNIVLIPINPNAAADISEFYATATTTGFTIYTTTNISHPANTYQFVYIIM